jgi:ribose 1,5-bisphosphokinase
MTDRIGPGAFVAVVGASGAGKDSIIDWAHESLAGEPCEPVFARRAITRPAGPGEEHLPLADAAFADAESGGRFAFTWRAHGLAYGVPREVDDAIRAGTTVVLNVSRVLLPVLAHRYERLRVVRVVVPDHLRRARLAARGREAGEAAETRMSRVDPAPEFPVDLCISNDRSLAEAGLEFAVFLRALREPTA